MDYTHDLSRFGIERDDVFARQRNLEQQRATWRHVAAPMPDQSLLSDALHAFVENDIDPTSRFDAASLVIFHEVGQDSDKVEPCPVRK